MPQKTKKTIDYKESSLIKLLKPGVLLKTLKHIITLPLPKRKRKASTEPFYQTLSELKASSQYMSTEEKGILNNFLQFGNKTVTKVMIPRSDICAISIDSSTEEINQTVAKYGHTRTLVYRDTLDNIVGFIHIKDLFDNLVFNQVFSLKKLLRTPIIAAPSMKLVDLLAEMQKVRTHIAIVIDEYGGTAGIITIEDIMEEIIGEIEDEHDIQSEVEEGYRLINPNDLISNARVNIEEIEKALDMQLREPQDEVETIGGLVLARAGCVPKIDSVIKLNQYTSARIIESSTRSIKTIKLTIDKN